MNNTAPSSDSLFAFAVGLPTRNNAGELLEAYFPAPRRTPDPGLANAIATLGPEAEQTIDADQARLLAKAARECDDAALATALDALADTGQPLLFVSLASDEAITSTAQAYLKLHLLSHRLAPPNSLNLDGIFAHLKNIAWTSEGAIDPSELPERIIKARAAGNTLVVRSIDKFPCMTDYVVPQGVRIADASRIRLGAYVGDGTTVMHEGFINFNAGAVGPNMVEGRISQGVIIGANTDLGGGASTMGTLSGGGSMIISIGENCLIGANGGTGIPLGDRCTIEAGLYITASTPVMLIDDEGNEAGVVKARQLAGDDDMLFIRNGRNGQVECRTNRSAIALNSVLHAHN
ncbi:MAG: tetrahydrodipicolinate N-succinyltransferase N-terminal domain-containing protein [Pseudomonadaceae bacterium]|nr:tetrahydrodipicolinate N-succinyltransferase N-terminal domain-containing protein [Pseudomonadaceae bacterium]